MSALVKDFAKLALDRGLHPIPCNADKSPAINREKIKDRPPTPKEIERWGNPMVGLICGCEVSPVLAIDFDQAGLFFEAYKARVMTERPELWARLTIERSMNRGFHIWIRTKRPFMTQKLAHNVIETEGPGEYDGGGKPIDPDNRPKKTFKAFEYRGKWVIAPDAIETRGATSGMGAYCLCAPSPGYVLIQGKILSMPLLEDEEVDYLISLAREFETYFPEPKAPKLKSEARTADGNRPGDDFNARGEILPILEKHGWTFVKQIGDRIHLARPGKTGCTSATLTDERIFYPFSSNSHPFESYEAYAPFSVYAMLEHDGDFAAAAKDLAAQGYGVPDGECDWNPDEGQRAEQSKFVNSYVSAEDLDTWTPMVKVWPHLERAAFNGIVGDFVDLATEGSEADPVAVLTTLLARFAVESGSSDSSARPHIYVGESRHEPRLFGVVVGKSAKARKGTSGAPVTRLFAVPEGSIGAPKMAPMSLGPLSSGEGIVYAVRDAQETWDDKEQQYKVVDPGVQDKRLFVQEEEFAAAINAGKRDGNTLSATLRALWDSGTRSPMTKTSRTQCTNAHVGILAHITLDELAMSLSACDKLNGYANRFLWILARRSKRVPRPRRMPDDRFIPIRDEIWKRLHLAHAAGQMRLTAAAGDLWDAEYDRLTEDRPGIAGAITARAEAQVVRLSMIYALCDGRKYVDAIHIQAALALWRYAQASAEFIFSDDVMGNRMDAKIKEILFALPAGMSLTEIHNATGNNHKAADLRSSIQRLVDAGLVRSESVRTAGAAKPKTVFYSNEGTNLRIYSDEEDDCKFVTSYISSAEIPDVVTI